MKLTSAPDSTVIWNVPTSLGGRSGYWSVGPRAPVGADQLGAVVGGSTTAQSVNVSPSMRTSRITGLTPKP